MHNPAQEMLLNKLLNEMDGLRENTNMLFILTTNRPDQLEPALASRPVGSIKRSSSRCLRERPDQAREPVFAGLELAAPLMDLIVRRTQGASPAFIKELMRRSAQFQLELSRDGVLKQEAVDGAIEEMVFIGGALNLKLLGGSGDLASIRG